MTCPKGRPSIINGARFPPPTPASPRSSLQAIGNRFLSVLWEPMQDGCVTCVHCSSSCAHVGSYQTRTRSGKFTPSNVHLVLLWRGLQMRTSCKTCKASTTLSLSCFPVSLQGRGTGWLPSRCAAMRDVIPDCSCIHQQRRPSTAEICQQSWISHPNSASLRETPSPPQLILLGLSFEQNLAVWLRAMRHARVELSLSRLFTG
jgi:hypothetical protein